jgi:hypothetical protein
MTDNGAKTARQFATSFLPVTPVARFREAGHLYAAVPPAIGSPFMQSLASYLLVNLYRLQFNRQS